MGGEAEKEGSRGWARLRAVAWRWGGARRLAESTAVGGEGPAEVRTLHTLPLSNAGIARAPLRMQSTAGPFSDGVLKCFFTKPGIEVHTYAKLIYHEHEAPSLPSLNTER